LWTNPLTNARRRAPGATVDVELDYDRTTLRIRVRDNGPGPATPPAEGHGLIGMRERTAMLGGRLWAGPTVTGGFLVDVTLPTTGAHP
jgi:signal transduction histidine kinase